jgi:hypothetical protein
MNREIEEILNTCIDRITLRGDSIENCLESYPDRARELEPLLKTAMEAREAFSEKPSREFQQEAKSRFLSKLVSIEKRREGFKLLDWQRRWAVAVCAVLALVIMAGGTVGASTNALPGDLMYSVKTTMERVQAFFTFGDEAKANLYIELAERRVEEIEALAERERDITKAALGVMGDETDRAILFTSRNAWSREEVVDKLVRLTGNQKQILTNLVQSAPTEVKVRIREALDHSEDTHNQALTIKARLQEHQNYEVSPRDTETPKNTPISTDAGAEDRQGQPTTGTEVIVPTPNGYGEISDEEPLPPTGGQQGVVNDSQTQATDNADTNNSVKITPPVIDNKGAIINTPLSSLGSNNEPSD